MKFDYGGSNSDLILKSPEVVSPMYNKYCMAMKIEPPVLFGNLMENCHPIATKSRKYSKEDRKFIKFTIADMLQRNITLTRVYRKLERVGPEPIYTLILMSSRPELYDA